MTRSAPQSFVIERMHLASSVFSPTSILQVGPFDRISIKGLAEFAPGKPFTLEGKRPDGTTYSFPVNHTLNEGQYEWFRHGSALNAMAAAAGHK